MATERMQRLDSNQTHHSNVGGNVWVLAEEMPESFIPPSGEDLSTFEKFLVGRKISIKKIQETLGSGVDPLAGTNYESMQEFWVLSPSTNSYWKFTREAEEAIYANTQPHWKSKATNEPHGFKPPKGYDLSNFDKLKVDDPTNKKPSIAKVKELIKDNGDPLAGSAFSALRVFYVKSASKSKFFKFTKKAPPLPPRGQPVAAQSGPAPPLHRKEGHLMPPRKIKMILFDFDQTTTTMHTRGAFTGNKAVLARSVASYFAEVVPVLLKAKYQVVIASHSDGIIHETHPHVGAGEDFMREILKMALVDTGKITPTELGHILIYGARPELRNKRPEYQGTNKMAPGKRWHVDQAIADYKIITGDQLRYDQCVLFDDDGKNINLQLNNPLGEKRTFAYKVSPSTGVTKDVWDAAMNDMNVKAQPSP
eukprot:CAMPEP_0170193930 /NCGR_PEP_ID=MMETSP0040_2-20121228/58049_1 /TAXON_ID=641309 /ORGANISM="Lotharella oceanica, Strain CCMP622" /LENGTH=421 /DNA_ID=CAMNT_0010442697 /DNA_START=38 /DNA_END=1303 /DNA_ORIENTATION=+